MASGDDLRRLALALDGTTEAPHFDRIAFKARRIYVTLAPERLTANFMFSPEDQQLKCAVAPEIFSPVANAWGAKGATTATLAAMTEEDLADALRIAWQRAVEAPAKRRGR